MASSGIDSLLEILGMPKPGAQGAQGAQGEGGAGQAGADASKNADDKGGGDSKGTSTKGGAGRGGRHGHGDGATLNLDFLDDIPSPKGKLGWVVLIVVALLVIAAAYWWFHPPISINSPDLWGFIAVICVVVFVLLWHRQRTYKTGSGKFEKSPSKEKRFKWLKFIPVVIVAIGVIGAVGSLAIVPGNAQRYSEILKTDTLNFADDIQEVDYSQIPVIDRDIAEQLGNKEMGTIPEYVSQFEISSLYSQINYKGAPVRVSPLGYADIFKWFTNRSGGIPAYALVNMTTQDAEIVRLTDNPIYYSESEPFVRNIQRHVQLSYPTYIFDEFSFEIDEDGQPWWICPVRKYTIGLFGGYTIDRVVLCNATTGETTDMAVSDVPEWVDRVYPAELLLQQYNWYGSYHNGWLNSFLGQEGVVRTTPGSNSSLGYNYIAKDDDVWVYTGVTSATSDSSIIGFVLINQRTQESHFYSVAGATEESAMSSAEGQVQNLRYTATFPLLINVANQPTYFMALKDSVGLAKKFAMVDIQRYQNVAVGDTVADTQTAYEALLATNGVITNETELTDVQKKTGTIDLIGQAVIDGNSHFYITLTGDSALYDFALPGLIDILRYKQGDTITFTYLASSGTNTVYSIVTDDGTQNATGLDNTQTNSNGGEGEGEGGSSGSGSASDSSGS